MHTPMQDALLPTEPYNPPPDLVSWIADRTWTFAKTVPDQPHWYVVRARLEPEHQDGYTALVEEIRTHGRKHRFLGRTYRYLLVDGWDYWTGPPGLVNRRRHLDQDTDLQTWTRPDGEPA